ncbi:hypothetical protein SAMN05192588_0942 [Nonlabens sp. Hel1_33_55]|uniref:hypothetical protein n=1 Tax=Nonlabens sp. Hel1_33_55 TaxID=1336802 RepID=UPI000875EC2F|nr:hypothetical protein [Nonlabens sp. Hel1_33_55]SCY06091.1 hypothetical protein SAMN05192588_0942 [Nonlabens sp. Hel1_33_55]
MIKSFINCFCLLCASLIFGQAKLEFGFKYQAESVDCTSFDFSKYGVMHHFLTLVQGEENYNTMVDAQHDCVKTKNDTYHTMYYIIRVPDILNNETEFIDFTKHTIQVIKDASGDNPSHRFIALSGDNVQLLNAAEEMEKSAGLNTRFFFYGDIDEQNWCSVVDKNAMKDLKKSTKKIKKAEKRFSRKAKN